MKTMQQMQNEMLKEARFDGGYPRPVVLPFGILALAKNEEEWNDLMRQSDITHAVLGIGIVAALIIPIWFLIFDILFV